MISKRWFFAAAVILFFFFGPLGIFLAVLAYVFFGNWKSQSGGFRQADASVRGEDGELEHELEEVKEELAENEARDYGAEPEGAEESISSSQREPSGDAEDFLKEQEKKHTVKVGGGQ